MRAIRPGDRRMILLGVAAAVVLAAGSTLAMAAAAGAFDQASPRPAAGSACLSPPLPGASVDVRLTDMGGPMMGGRYPSGPMMGGQYRSGMMRVLAAPGTVSAGTVSFRVRNVGALTHELVVLPLPSGQVAGQRTIGGDGRVEETASSGEASRSCGVGAGDGIAPGASGWVSLRLSSGRYELVCNLPGHYQAGMYTTLTVT